jgi:tetratricopeptide (TPR) repeat protein
MAKILALNPEEKVSLIKKAQKYFDEDKVDLAAAAVEDYMLRHPDDAQALVLMALIMKRIGKPAIAYPLAKRSTETAPNRSETWCTLGRAAQDLWLLDEAQKAYRRALNLATNTNHKALYTNNVGSIHLDKGEFKEAEQFFRDSITLDSNEWRPRHNLALSLLAQSRWREGWEQYSSSVGTHARLNWKYRKPPNEEPTWDGTKGKKVIVFGEQGLGDEISFASMIPDACNDAEIIVDCDKRLKGLFERSFPKAKVYGTRNEKQLAWDEADRNFDASISMGELGKLYRNEDEDFPGTAYLTPCPVRTAAWKGAFAEHKKPVIGIAWSGGTWTNGAPNRELPLDEWGPIFKSIDAHWVSLQYKDASKQIEGSPVVQYPWATLTKDYDDTAALVAACDMVICMQTAVAHVAGAMGVPVWVMVPKNSQWRYGTAQQSLPWYKSLRIFRSNGSWSPVVNRIANELKNAHL